MTGGPKIRFYAGVPLVTPEGHSLGTLCVIDRKPRQLNASQLEALRVLSRQVLTQLELRRRLAELSRASTALGEANAELESFYHAVSHDLRAPLGRGVGGVAHRHCVPSALDVSKAHAQQYACGHSTGQRSAGGH